MWVFTYVVKCISEPCVASLLIIFFDRNTETNHNEIVVVYKTKFAVMV